MGLKKYFLRNLKPIRVLLVLGISIFSIESFSQSVGIGTTTPNAKSILELSSTSQGLLPPRMTTIQRTSIAPGVLDYGLVVYDTDNSEFYYWDGLAWKTFGGSLPPGNLNETMRYDGANWVANNFLNNSGSNISIGGTGLWGLVGILGNQRNTLNLTVLDNSHDAGISWQNAGGNYVWNIYREQASGGGNASLVFAGGQNEIGLASLIDRFRISQVGNIGINNSNPLSLLHMKNGVFRMDRYALSPKITMNRAQGTEGSETAIVNNVNIGTFEYGAWDPGVSDFVPVASFIAEADGDHSSGNLPTRIKFKTTPVGSSADVDRLVIKNNGDVGINVLDPNYKLEVNGSGEIDTLTINDAYTFPTTDGVSGSVLKTDGLGNIAWGAPGGGTEWQLAGNSIAAGDKLGTTNAQDLVIVAGNNTAMTIDDATRNIGIGTAPSISTKIYAVGSGTDERTLDLYNIYSGANPTYGLVNTINNSATGQKWATLNLVFTGSSTNMITGTQNSMNSSTSAITRGTTNEIQSTGSGLQIGNYNNLNNAGTGHKYAINNYVRHTSNLNSFGVYSNMDHDGSGSSYGNYIYDQGSGSGEHIGSYHSMSGNSSGTIYGVYNQVFEAAGAANMIYGSRNALYHSGSGRSTGAMNSIYSTGTGEQIGVDNYVWNAGTGIKYGIYSRVNHTGGAATGNLFGSYNSVTSTSTSTHQAYGFYTTINHNSTAGGNAYGFFANLNSTTSGTEYGLWVQGEDINYLSGNLGIGTSAPSAKLDVVGTFQLVDGTQGVNKILTSDGTGNASWSDAAAVSANIYNTDGSLLGLRTVSFGANNMVFNLDGAGDFHINGGGLGESMFLVNNAGTSFFGGNVWFNSTNTSGTNLVSISDNLGDGRIRIYQGGNVQHDIRGGGAVVFNQLGLDQDYRIEGLTDQNLFYLDASVNNIGIGTSTPSQKLDVDNGGSVEVDGEYTYETAKTHYYTIDPMDLERTDNPITTNMTYQTVSGSVASLYFSGGTGVSRTVTAPIRVPNGATITEVRFYIYDNSVSDMTFSLERKVLSSTTTTSIGSISSSGASTVVRNYAFTASEVVNNASNMYRAKVVFDVDNAGTNLKVFGVRVTYTVNKAD